MTQSLLQMVLKKNACARDVWTNLEHLFRVNKDSKAMQLDNELRSITMGDLSATSYFSKIKTMADLLENIGSPVPEKNLVIYAVNGLTPSFVQVASIIRHRDPLPSFIETRSMVLLEEQQLARQNVSTPSAPKEHSSSPTILHANSGSGNTRDNNNRRLKSGGPPPRRRSWEQNPPQHPPTYGWVYIQPPQQTGQQQTRSPGNQNRAQQQYRGQQQRTDRAGLLGVAPRPSSSQTHRAYVAENDTTDQATSLPELFSTMSLRDPENSGWIMDTGATDRVHAQEGPDNP